jgi:hypothetical protein
MEPMSVPHLAPALLAEYSYVTTAREKRSTIKALHDSVAELQLTDLACHFGAR